MHECMLILQNQCHHPIGKSLLLYIYSCCDSSCGICISIHSAGREWLSAEKKKKKKALPLLPRKPWSLSMSELSVSNGKPEGIQRLQMLSAYYPLHTTNRIGWLLLHVRVRTRKSSCCRRCNQSLGFSIICPQ